MTPQYLATSSITQELFDCGSESAGVACWKGDPTLANRFWKTTTI